MTQRPRIGLLTPGWPGQKTPNGIATSVYSLALGMHGIGQTPVILAEQIDGPPPPDIPVISIPRLGWRLRDRLRAKLGNPDAGHLHIARNIAAAIQEAIRIYSLDVVIMEETNGWAGMVQPLVSVPVIITLHGPWVLHKSLQSKSSPEADRQRENRESCAFARAAGLIAPSRNVLAAIERASPLPDTPKIVLPNTLASDAEAPLSAELNSTEVLFVGRFDTHKGGDTVLKAHEYLARTHPQARLTFAGPDRGLHNADGSTLHLEAALAALPEVARTHVTYKGPVDRDEVARLRTRHPIALIASRYENLNYTLLEAMAAGQAIVCTAVGGPAEVLQDGKTALLVPPDDPKTMAAALGRLLDDHVLRQRLGTAARAKVQSYFDPRTVAAQTVNFVEKVCKLRTLK